MTWLENVKIKTQIFAAFAIIGGIAAVAGLLGSQLFVIAALVIGLAGGAFFASQIGGRMQKLCEAAEGLASGNTDRQIDISSHDEIGVAAESLRKAANSQKEFVRVLNQISQGIYTENINAHSGNDIEKALAQCINNGRFLEQEIGRIAESMNSGKLRERCKTDQIHGAHSKVVSAINSSLNALVKHPGKAIGVLTKVVEGDLTARMNEAANGDHALFQSSLNLTIKTLDDALSRVGFAAEQVSSASHQISQGSQTLSQKAAEQAGSIEEVSSSLHEVAAMTKANSENAKEARQLSKVAESSVEEGVESMKRLSDAINKIKVSSDSTAKIIKTIDEIAFQTNLLALNAAVEAARAGDAGKGFAVVAEEVRNLAMRSAEAAKNTANLIEESVKNSENGVALNQEVLKNLGDINGQVKKVGSVMAEIAEASEQQTQGVEQVNTVITQMNLVTQQVAANAEESAGGAEELSGQAEELRAMVRAFTLTNVDMGSTLPSASFTRKKPQSKKAGANASSPAPIASVQKEAAKMIPLDEGDSWGLGTF